MAFEGAAYAAVAGLIVALSGATHVLNLNAAFKELRDPDKKQYYVGRDLALSLDFLAAHSLPDDIVLTSLMTSELIPGWSGNTVVYGHWAQTVDQGERDAWVAKVLSPASGIVPSQRLKMLRADGMRFVLVDDDVRKILGGKIPDWLSATGPSLFRSGRIELFRL